LGKILFQGKKKKKKKGNEGVEYRMQKKRE
jgi:hypothetical protein